MVGMASQELILDSSALRIIPTARNGEFLSSPLGVMLRAAEGVTLDKEAASFEKP
jgi:hypothetical protein